MSDEVIEKLATIAKVPAEHLEAFGTGLKMLVVVMWIFPERSPPKNRQSERDPRKAGRQLAKVEKLARALHAALSTLDEPAFFNLSAYVSAAEFFEIGGTLVQRGARVAAHLEALFGRDPSESADRRELSNFTVDVLRETFGGDPVKRKRARVDFVIRMRTYPECTAMRAELGRKVTVIEAIAEGASYSKLWDEHSAKGRGKKRGQKSTMPVLGLGHESAKLRDKSSSFDRLVISFLDLADEFGGELKFDKNYGTGTLAEFISAARPHFPPGLIPEKPCSSRLNGLRGHWIANRASLSK